MYTLSINMWFQKLMRQFFMGIDGVVYNFISTIYDLLISIARTSILTQADIMSIAEKIYNLLAIFMIFKVTLSLITYVVNPDDFSDKTKGISKLGTNIVISLGLLILTPYIFNYAYRFQTFILEDNSLANLILADETSNNTSGSHLNSAGDEIAFMTMSAFFYPNTSITELQNCVNQTIKAEENGKSVKKFNPECSGLKENYQVDDSKTNSLAGVQKDNSNFHLSDLQNYVAGVENESLGLMFRQNIGVATDSSGDVFIIEYRYIFSTVVGVVVVLLLVTFCMDVALRSVKLAFLQLIAPIPILSYVDPKSGKDGMFKKWYQLCFKTYLSLFVRLLGLYFAIYIISLIDDMVDVVDGTVQTNLFIKIFVIIGALMFAKDLPKILEGLGIKLDGGGKFTLNPLRKIENEAMGGKYLKKPNDMLGKLGKNILKSPITAASTTGKRLVAGAYSAANGRGFKRGYKSVDSPFKKTLNKKIDEWAPDFAKDRQEARVAQMDALENSRKEKKVSKYFGEDRKKGKEMFLNDLGNADSRYRALYDDAERKKVEMYEAQARSNRWISTINNGLLTEPQRKMLSATFNKEGKILTDDQLIQNLQKASGTAEKVYNKAVETKESYGKTSSSARRAAALDKAYDSYDKLHPSVGAGSIPMYSDFKSDTESHDEKIDNSDVGFEQKKSSSLPNTDESGTSVLEDVERSTDVSTISARESGATTDGLIESIKKEILEELEKQKRIHDTTSDGNEMVRASMRIRELERELEDIRRKNS